MRGLMSSRFASARTLREGSVGLLILLGLGVFGVIILWLNRFTGGSSSYKAIVEFANAGGMQKGAPVRFRGVKVGSITKVQPKPNSVEVEIQIAPADLIIPSETVIEANQTGLISESIIDIIPKTSLPTGATVAKPLDKNCNPSLIICNGSRLKGQIGISTDDLIRQSTNFAAAYSNEKFAQNVNKLMETSADAASSVAALSKDLQSLSRSFKGQLGIFSGTAVTLQRATNQLTTTTTRTANVFGNTANEFSTTAKQFSLTASQASRLLNNLDNLVTTNRSSLVGALNNITQTSNQLRQTVTSLSPAVNRLTQGELLKNLETLSANAAQASANLRDASKALNDPKNSVLLQQTLDSARVTFENTQKITSDLDELTGDPAFRKNLLQLVNGLSKLVSSTQQMQQEAQVAVTLDALKASVNQPDVAIAKPKAKASVNQPDLVIPALSPKVSVNQPDLVAPPPPPIQQPLMIKPAPLSVERADNQTQTTATPRTSGTPNSSQEQLVQQLRDYGKQGN
ncbi:ABC-type transport system involved in resistance to organic solvents, periplasmic component [Cylindrospermum stagnale PCC 7417]|uniref:ABC-type transport system involved in resistance to organic solvents, periplasmic component n=1 Tax=Cylindrospermum stagnale PCC 7417 TaxID=56107 RepID=K9WW10_9NOST|nr:MlaD family protein [Cylindrospermum stagnale]AFZ23981.1 ABC-type transport system involved in resistance to organic solvents, periplasmic component [Cylindrospermum stagnale PCC 7417]